MIKKVLSYIAKNIFYDIAFILTFIFISYFLLSYYKDYKDYKDNIYNFTRYKNNMDEIYELAPQLFSFDENNIATIEITTIIENEHLGYAGLGIIPMTEDYDQCMGYIIAKREDNKLKYDYSHMCDMVDH